MELLLSACCLLLTGLDCAISWKRWKELGPASELNPLVRKAIQDMGVHGGLATLLMLNLFLIAIFFPWRTPLAILLGAKLGLAALQLKSLELKNNGK